jgi:hypothetical protein
MEMCSALDGEAARRVRQTLLHFGNGSYLNIGTDFKDCLDRIVAYVSRDSAFDMLEMVARWAPATTGRWNVLQRAILGNSGENSSTTAGSADTSSSAGIQRIAADPCFPFVSLLLS